MAFKAKKRSALTGIVEFSGAFQGARAEVRYVSPEHNRELVRRATRNGEFDVERYSQLYCGDAVVALQGVTPDMLQQVVEFDEGSDQPDVTDGEVVATPELIYFLWRSADPTVFQNQIYAVSKELLRQAALEKKLNSTSSSG